MTPEKILVAGDWHGNLWCEDVIGQVRDLLPEEEVPLIMHTGDLGIWPGLAGRRYLEAVDDALVAANARLEFVDGNHDDHDQLAELKAAQPTGPIRVTERITWLPRGHRWDWHGRTWLALGGAVSVNRQNLIDTKGHWWPAERITPDQAAAVIAGGPADVMVTHDCPAGVPLSLPPPLPWWTDADMARANAHRDVLADVCRVIRPQWLMHGHFHMYHQSTVDLGWGPMQVTGLDCDDTDIGNHAVLDVRNMTWNPPEATGVFTGYARDLKNNWDTHAYDPRK